MKKIILLSVVSLAVNIVFSQGVEKLWETEKVLDIPESVLYDDTVIYVSNVNGKPTDKNELGYLSKLSPDGQIIELKWVEGLHAPKGMAVFENKLYVTDIDRVAIINRSSGEIINFIEVEGAKFLNDAAGNKKGEVFISDMYDNAIYKIENEKIELLSKHEDLSYVNGLCWGNGQLYAGTNGIVYKVNTETGNISKFIEGTGGIDGLEKVNEKFFIISDWSGKVQLISTQQPPVLLFDYTEKKINAADIDYVPEYQLLLVPTFYAKSVVAYKLNP